MSRTIIFCSVVFAVLAFAGCDMLGSQTSEVWSLGDAERYVQDRENANVWDFEMLATDLATDSLGIGSEPMKIGAFPVPKYDLLGGDTFHGLGFYNNYRPFGTTGKHLIYSAFMLRRNKLNAPYLPKEKSDEVFFMIAVLSDTAIDTLDYTHCVNSMTSRNHPHYVGQGRIKTERTAIDYLAFLTADRYEYALVNMRLFDLRQGRLILIAPQQDGSLRSMQIAPGRIFSLNETETVLDTVLCRKSVLAFFHAPGAI